MKRVDAIIVGGTGFGAGELLRLLLNHPDINVTAVVSSSASGKSISSSHPHLLGLYEHLTFTQSVDELSVDNSSNTVFICALPHGQSAATVKKLNIKFPQSRIIDLSGDLRLKDLRLHERFYPNSDTSKELREISVYGLPELNSSRISNAKIISNPGCLATAAIISMLPVASLPNSVKLKTDHAIVLNLATGSSGAGKEPKQSTHHPIRHANFFNYKPFEHQHEPEIQQALLDAGIPISSISFVAHSLPISRGILCTTYYWLTDELDLNLLYNHYKSFYSKSPFIRVLKDSTAEIENIVGSNFCDISIATRGNQVVVTSVLDNLVKGMAGQAIENINIMFGLDRMSGLRLGGLRPV